MLTTSWLLTYQKKKNKKTWMTIKENT
jgi:hypothetical protein